MGSFLSKEGEFWEYMDQEKPLVSAESGVNTLGPGSDKCISSFPLSSL